MTQAPNYYYAHVQIKISCLRNTNKLVLHSHSDHTVDPQSFEIFSLTQPNTNIIKELNNRNGYVKNWYFDNETDFLVVEFNREVFQINNNYSVSIGFTGKLLSDNSGFYRSNYLDNDGNKRWLTVFDLEPIEGIPIII